MQARHRQYKLWYTKNGNSNTITLVINQLSSLQLSFPNHLSLYNVSLFTILYINYLSAKRNFNSVYFEGRYK